MSFKKKYDGRWLDKSAIFNLPLTPAYPVHPPHNVLVGAATMHLVVTSRQKIMFKEDLAIIYRHLCREPRLNLKTT
jgi:hypothetical protein